MRGFRRLAALALPVLLGGALGTGAGMLPASAAPVCAPLTTVDHSYVSPIHFGQALDAINWGGSGHASTACSGALVNDNIKTWTYHGAGVAADFTAVVTGVGIAQLVYTPGNQVNVGNPLCVSTVLDSKGAFARLRPCAGLTVTVDAVTGNAAIAATTGNQWQNFSGVSEGDGFVQLEAVHEPVPYSLNIAGFGGSGTQVISWTPLVADACEDNSALTPCSENEIFEVLAAA